MDSEDRNRKEYELAVLVKREEDLPGIAAVVRDHAGEITADFRAKRVALAYPIKKEKEAIFAYAHFRAIGETAKALEHDLNVRHDVLRSLVVILPKPDKKGTGSARAAIEACSCAASFGVRFRAAPAEFLAVEQ